MFEVITDISVPALLSLASQPSPLCRYSRLRDARSVTIVVFSFISIKLNNVSCLL